MRQAAGHAPLPANGTGRAAGELRGRRALVGDDDAQAAELLHTLREVLPPHGK